MRAIFFYFFPQVYYFVLRARQRDSNLNNIISTLMCMEDIVGPTVHGSKMI